MVSRLVHQKGLDIVADTARDIVREGGQIAILGLGDPETEHMLSRLARRHRDNIGLLIGFNEPMARRIVAASDFCLMPSRFEPCGLTQMQAQRYGTLPIAHATGGLADTIEDGETGFLFSDLSGEGLFAACRRAFEAFDDPDAGRDAPGGDGAQLPLGGRGGGIRAALRAADRAGAGTGRGGAGAPADTAGGGGAAGGGLSRNAPCPHPAGKSVECATNEFKWIVHRVASLIGLHARVHSAVRESAAVRPDGATPLYPFITDSVARSNTSCHFRGRETQLKCLEPPTEPQRKSLYCQS